MEYIFIGLGIVLLGCFALMALFSYLANHVRGIQSRKALSRIADESPYNKKSKPKHSRRGDDFLSRDKVAEKKAIEERETGVVKYNIRQQELEEAQQQGSEIVGVAEPVGFWSKFIRDQKIGFIIMLGGLMGNKKGYWQNYIKAQSASQGKNQTRGR